MASRSIRLLLLAIVLELFAFIFGVLGPFNYPPFPLNPVWWRPAAVAIGVIGLVVALVGVFARE